MGGRDSELKTQKMLDIECFSSYVVSMRDKKCKCNPSQIKIETLTQIAFV